MQKRFAMFLSIVFLFAAVPVLNAQTARIENEHADTSAFPTISIQFDLRSAPGGELVDTLTSADVNVLEGQQLMGGELHPAQPADGIAYVVLVDTSGSMTRLLPEIQAGLQKLVDSLGEKDRMALVRCDDSVEVVRPLTADHADLKSALDQLTPRGTTTQLYLGAYRSIELFAQPGVQARRILLIVSDGHDEGTAYTLDDCISKAKQAGANVIGLGVTIGEKKYLLNLERMAELTSGFYSAIDAGQSWTEKIALVPRHARSRVVFTWTSNLPQNGQKHQVRLQVTYGGAAVFKDIQIEAPLAPPPPAIPWWRQWQIWTAVATAILVISAVLFFIFQRNKKRRKEMEDLKKKLEEGAAKQSETEKRLGEKLDAVSQGIGDLRKAPAAPAIIGQAAPPSSQPPAASSPVQKRKTVFQSGSTAVPETKYRGGIIEVLTGPLQGSHLPLPPGRVTLGRSPENQIVVDDEKASSLHAAISSHDGLFWLEDQNSTNGTYINEGPRLTGRIQLINGMQIRIGGTRFLFRGEA